MAYCKPEGLLLGREENNRWTKSLPLLRECCDTGRILEGRALVCDSEHNLVVALGGGLRGVIPRTEGALGMEDGTTRDIALISRVGKAVCFRVTGFRTEADGAVTPLLSRRAVQLECMREYVLRLSPGDVIPAKVTHLEPFGCFVDIGCGIPSLIPIDAISVSRIFHPRDRFQPGDDILAVVREVDAAGRVSLSHKELLGTWEENAALFTPGETVAGIVRSVEDYGIFVELTPNLAGLAEPRENVLPGQQASVYIKSLIPEKMKVKLIIVDAFEARSSGPTPEYFITGGRIGRWRYSPPACPRVVESRFDLPPERPEELPT